MRTIVAGSRTYTNYRFAAMALDAHLRPEVDEIVSGGARGADALGEQYARERHLHLTIFPAKWSEHGKAAGAIRNKAMAEYADEAIVFWNGYSRGSKNMIDTMKKFGKPVLVIDV